ncbi:sugar ABC transporter ATP-binding protein [Alicyclobacillus mali]|uniref:Sugar ABC transporter ATP-binding protein n=1 Tax=Alicyclobacillus mali (ex Roth et al. 2021) TaxID=1123961 RepID=A0ABS0EZR7_9BACL|nr:ATP-binding cassette domain-containing protein [Alicyclobacillus mali (ex Roth et al. 2021)]MBF8376537.1 sugar ABC transporter ATP-binding protein [Alicyclobacillus mali (ex Roth et al. 2021)]MCL6489620.1 ATP-binding cassette domain-containing protein [Alicyclobacillus mali (ex Roth et al. 2021)]
MATEVKTQPVLEVRNLRKRFGAVQALDGVSFSVHAGEIVALVGDNGAGKSTTIKMIAGVEQPDEGDIVFEGQAVRLTSPAVAEKYGIQTVYQDLALCDNLDIVSNLFLGRELRRNVIPGVVRVIDRNEMERRAIPVLNELGIRLPPLHTQVASLSGGQRQTVAVARSVLWGSKLVMLDEPTAALGVVQQRAVLELIQRLAASGRAVLVISHNMSDVFKIANRIVVLRLGRTVATFDREQVTPEQVVAAITGASAQEEVTS